MCSSDLADYITYGRRPEKEIDFLDDEQAKQFYAYVQNISEMKKRTAMTLLILTGIRRGELCGLNWEDVDFINETLTVRRSYSVITGHGAILNGTKTKSSNREISMPSLLVETLRAYKIEQDDIKEILGDKWENSGAIMINSFGARLHPEMVNCWLNEIIDKLGFEHKTVHSLRHTNVTLQIMQGVPLPIVSARVGHARTSTTTDIYTHFIKSSDRAASKKLNDIFTNI